MLRKMSDCFAGVKMTTISGIFLLASLGCMLGGYHLPADPAWITVVLSGYPLLYLAVTRLLYDKWVSSALLISIAMIASLCIGELFAAGEVAFIMAIGAILEDKTVDRARQGLFQLIALAPAEGRRLIIKEGRQTEEMIAAKEIAAGDILRILPGEKIPADGKILSGSTAVDQAVLTGESLPVDKTCGDDVFCGTQNCFGSIDIEAAGVGEDSSLQKLIRMVKEAEQKKAPVQRIADKWAVWLVPIALSIAFLAFIINYWAGLDRMDALNRGVTVLVVFCPCALALATPTSVMAAIGQAAKYGIIIKSGEALESMGRIDTIAFDKTGTLTLGKLEVSDVISFSPEINEDTLLTLTASAEQKSEHPLGQAIVAHARNQQCILADADAFQMNAGKGVSASISGRRLICGNEAYLTEHDIVLTLPMKNALEQIRRQGKAAVLIAAAPHCLGLIALTDVLRPDARILIDQLSSMNTETILLTGDNIQAAEYFAQQAGIHSVRADLLPEQKVSEILLLKKDGRNVCMIGDGINDAPALKTADVGIAMGIMGTDITVEAADISLMSDDLVRIAYLKRLSRSALNTIKGNIAASMAINFVAVLLSAFGILNPVTGALVHNAGSVLVVLNAALLYDRNFAESASPPQVRES
ncbi:MAG: heavy metal translocating P-type ATPase [Lachnospiraceae bacterium]